MLKSFTHKFQRLPQRWALALLLAGFFYCPDSMASQDAMVIVDEALIYSDMEMTSPIGFVSRGKKLKVGEVPRNKGQVYPVVVSGKIAYIRVLDITTEKEGLDSTRLTAERFQKNTSAEQRSKLVFSYYSFASQISLSARNAQAKNNDSFLWHGLSLRGEALVKKQFDIQVLTNAMTSSFKDERFRVVEFGFGVAYRVLNYNRFIARLDAQALAIPFSTYEQGDLFRVKSFGYSLGSNLNLTYLFNTHWGIEAYGGPSYTKLLSFDAPEPYKDFSATFVGARVGVGVNYTY